MTDLVCEYEPWKGGLVHKGMKVGNIRVNSLYIRVNSFSFLKFKPSHQQTGSLETSHLN